MARRHKKENSEHNNKPNLSNKLDHRLLIMIDMDLPHLMKLKQIDHELYQQQVKEIEELGSRFLEKESEKEKLVLEEEYHQLKSSFPVPFTFGLYSIV